mgnify:FL=1
MKIKKTNKYLYLISPNQIKKNFYRDLNEVFKSQKVKFFQLRLKNYTFEKKLNIGRKVNKICKKYGIYFLVNDDPHLALKINADGCHLGQKDMLITNARKILKNRIIGITCHNSKKLIKEAVLNKADYIAIGAFYKSRTKKQKFKANLNLLKWTVKNYDTPIVAIGGINSSNYKKLLLHNANFLAISGFVWSNKLFKPRDTLRFFK